MTRYCIGDIHGNYKALMQVLERAKFNYEKDLLIVLGDVVDGYCNSFECVEELIKIKNKIFIIGNHDVWFMDYMSCSWTNAIWLSQGGDATLKSYDTIIPQHHKDFFNNGFFSLELDNMLFVHGGFNYPTLPKDETIENLTWDREFLHRVKCGLEISEWKKIFLGHTAVENPEYEPVFIDNGDDYAKVIQMDCGAGWTGKLCMMNIDTEEYVLSDKFEGGPDETKTN